MAAAAKKPIPVDDLLTEDTVEEIDPLETFDKESHTNLMGGYLTHADPVPLYRCPDLLTAEGMSAYMKNNYGVEIQVIPPGYRAVLVKKTDEDE